MREELGPNRFAYESENEGMRKAYSCSSPPPPSPRPTHTHTLTLTFVFWEQYDNDIMIYS